MSSVVAVSTDDQRARLLDDLEAAGYDTVIVESLQEGYTCIRREKPDTVIVYLAIDDPAVCQLLSMLALDPETAGIPVITWAERFDGGGLDDFIASAIPESSRERVALRMN